MKIKFVTSHPKHVYVFLKNKSICLAFNINTAEREKLICYNNVYYYYLSLWIVLFLAKWCLLYLFLLYAWQKLKKLVLPPFEGCQLPLESDLQALTFLLTTDLVLLISSVIVNLENLC